MSANTQESLARRQQLENRRQLIANKMRDYHSAHDATWSAENQRQWEQLNLEHDEISVEQRKMTNSRIGRDGATLKDFPGDRNGGTDQTLDHALRAWTLNSLGKRVTPNDADACERYGIALNANAFEVRLPIHGPTAGLHLVRNALSTESGPSGGYSVPTGFIPRLERALLSYAGVMQAAEVMTTESGIQLPWPTSNDSDNSGSLIGENTAASDSGADPKFGAIVFTAYDITSNVVRVPNALLDDTGVNLESSLGDMLGERIGRALNPLLTTGTGAAQPMGIITAATAGVTAASTTAIVFDELKDLEASVDPAYLTGFGGVGYMCHNSVWNYIKKLKDGDGRYLWQPSTQAGMPATLNGWPVFLNQSMDSTIASGKKTVLFGLLNKYKVRKVKDIRLLKLVERYAEYNQVGFIAYARFDGNLLDAGTHPVKYLVH